MICSFQLANWVAAIRYRRQTLLRTSGLGHEPLAPGKSGKILTKTLTLERVRRLDSVGFVWSVTSPKVEWEDRFQEAVKYFEGHGHWPPQTLGKLGEWVERQRRMYKKGGANFMRDKAPKVREPFRSFVIVLTLCVTHNIFSFLCVFR